MILFISNGGPLSTHLATLLSQSQSLTHKVLPKKATLSVYIDSLNALDYFFKKACIVIDFTGETRSRSFMHTGNVTVPLLIAKKSLYYGCHHVIISSLAALNYQLTLRQKLISKDSFYHYSQSKATCVDQLRHLRHNSSFLHHIIYCGRITDNYKRTMRGGTLSRYLSFIARHTTILRDSTLPFSSIQDLARQILELVSDPSLHCNEIICAQTLYLKDLSYSTKGCVADSSNYLPDFLLGIISLLSYRLYIHVLYLMAR